MSIKTETDQILAGLNAQTQAIAELTKAVLANQTAPRGTPADNSAILAAIEKLQASVTDIQSQVEDAPAPAPAEPAPAPTPEPAPAA